jgi:hypothetical protein
MGLLEQIISRFGQIKENTGVPNTEVACALLMVAGLIANT